MEEQKELIIMTGACGRIGKALIRQLGEEYHIIAMDLLGQLSAVGKEELLAVDLSSDDSVYQAFQYIKDNYSQYKIASVIHLAAYYSFSERESPLYEKITIEGTKRLLKALRAFSVEQLIFSSTMLVHAPCQIHEKITESWPLKEDWGYPRSKIRTEEIIRQQSREIPYVIFRIAGAYDEQCSSIPISHQIQRIYEKTLESHFFPGNLAHGSSFVHFDDVVSAFLQAIKKRHELSKETVLLIGEPKTLSYGEMQKKISKFLWGKEMHTFSMPKAFAKLGAAIKNAFTSGFIKPWMVDIADDNYILDISRAKKILNWQPKRYLADELQKMLERLQEDPHGWYKHNGLE